MAKEKDTPEETPTPIAKGKWDDDQDLFEGEDDSVVASAKARVIADELKLRRAKRREEAEEIEQKKSRKQKKASGWL